MVKIKRLFGLSYLPPLWLRRVIALIPQEATRLRLCNDFYITLLLRMFSKAGGCSVAAAALHKPITLGKLKPFLTKTKIRFMNPKTIWNFYKDYIQARAHISHKSLNVVGKKRQHSLSVMTSLGCKNKHVITNPYQTLEGFLKSLHVISFFYKKNLPILIVNTNPDFAFMIENFFHKTDLNNLTIYYCNEKWVGGLLTNWKQATKRVQIYIKFSERFDNFILQNQINFPSYKKMALSFQGLKPQNKSKLIQRPSLLFIVNPNENRHVVEEAVRLNIPVMAITDSNTPLSGISFPIPGNSNSVYFVHYCLQWIARIITGCKKQQTKKRSQLM